MAAALTARPRATCVEWVKNSTATSDAGYTASDNDVKLKSFTRRLGIT
jgi:hypothetical protein